MNVQDNTLAHYQAAVKSAEDKLYAWEIDADSDAVQDAFRDMLSDAYGTIDVCGMTMYASKVLEECDPIAFREGLLNYVDGLNREDFKEYQELADALEAALEDALEAALESWP